MLVISGFSLTDKVPGAYGEVVYGAGASSAADAPLKVLLVGKKLAAGTAVADTQVKPIFSPADARAYFAARSELANMCITSLRVPGVQLYAIAVAEAGGAVAATATITIAGTWTSPWDFEYTVDGEAWRGTIAATDTVTQAAVKIRDAYNANADGCAVATNVAGVVTLTIQSKGTSGNRYILWDTSKPASGATSTAAGGASVTGGGVLFSGGTGTEDVTNVLATINPSKYDRIGIGQIDSTNIGKWKTQVNAQADVLSDIRQHAVVASNDSLANGTSIAQTTLNAQRFQLAWMVEGESHPSRIAAAMAALRAQKEQDYPNSKFDGLALAGIAPQRERSVRPNHSTLVSALNNGVTPITSTDDGFAVIVRSITTRSLDGTNPDYKTLDTGKAVVPDYILADQQAIWRTEIAPNNEVVAPDTSINERRKPSGVITPDIWKARCTGRMRDFEAGKGLKAPIVIGVTDNTVTAEYQEGSGNARIMTAVDATVAPNNHQVGISVRQVA
jgi:phage tail sheath gpL-like